MKLLVFLAFAFFSGFTISAGEYKCGSIECYEFSPDTKDKESLQRGLWVSDAFLSRLSQQFRD